MVCGHAKEDRKSFGADREKELFGERVKYASDHFEAVQSLQIPVYFTTPTITFRPTINGGLGSGTGVTLLPSMISRIRRVLS
ncbi:hypothetical protein ACKUB1_06615 [Methanospirillum stamsii]|uniref:hypothetical protein n=1 Tax=Methanospirillum stamsii TaxID=1277351 RepID=UPI0011B2000D|nr:hypothetical protein [Methanospirillum stamsii]